MAIRKFSVADASFNRVQSQEGGMSAANLVDQRHGSPVSVGYGRYAPNEHLTEELAVDDVMIVIEGELSVTSDGVTVRARSGEIVHMPKGSRVTIRAHDQGALTAYVTYPHWQETHG